MNDQDPNQKPGLTAEEFERRLTSASQYNNASGEVAAQYANLFNQKIAEAAQTATTAETQVASAATRDHAQVSGQASKEAKEETKLSVEERLRQTYDLAFEQMVKEAVRLKSIGYHIQEKLLQFRKQNVLWAEVRGKTYHAVEEGKVTGSFLVVLPPGHKMGNFGIKLDGQGKMNFGQISAHEITEPWAAITVTNLLQVLYSRFHGLEPENPNRSQYLLSSYTAYEAETQAANALSGNRLLERASELFSQFKINTFNDLRRTFSNQKKIDLIIKTLDPLITPLPAKSKREAMMRGGLYQFIFLMNLVWREIELQKNRPVNMPDYKTRIAIELMDRFLEAGNQQNA
jgi:hypothetical protein